MRPPLRYFGAKVLQAPRIVELLPEHETYCEPFFGSGAVLFAKEPSRIEIAGDINPEVVNVHRAIRKHPQRVKDSIPLVASRETWEAAVLWCAEAEQEYRQPTGDTLWAGDTITKYAASFQAIGQIYSAKCGMGFEKDGSVRKSKTAIARERILPAGERLKDVHIRRADAIQLIQLEDYDDALFYLDPPYLYGEGGSRTSTDRYQFEANSLYLSDLIDCISDLKGKALLSTDDGAFWSQSLPAPWREVWRWERSSAKKKKQANSVLYANFGEGE